MKNYWFVMSFRNREGKLYAAASPFNHGYNLVYQFDPAAGCVTANICETKKQAETIAQLWNEAYKKNGTYAFDDKK